MEVLFNEHFHLLIFFFIYKLINHNKYFLTINNMESLHEDLLGGARGGERGGARGGGQGAGRRFPVRRQVYSHPRASGGGRSTALSIQVPRSSHVRPGLSFAQATSPPKGISPPGEAVTEGVEQQDWTTVTSRRNRSSPKPTTQGPDRSPGEVSPSSHFPVAGSKRRRSPETCG